MARPSPVAIMNPPMLISSGLPEDEGHATWTISIWLIELHAYVDSFEAALYIYDDYSARIRRAYQNDKDPDIPPRTVFVAARDAAMTIYHLTTAMRQIKATLTYCPTLKEHVDHDMLKLAQKRLAALAPGIENLRHAISHAGTANKKFTDPDTGGKPASWPKGMIEVGNIWHRRYTTTIMTKNGRSRNVSYELSKDTLDALKSITNQYTSAFIPAAIYLSELPSIQKKEESKSGPTNT